MAYANVAAASSGDNTLVTAVTGKKIRVTGMVLIARGAVDAYIKDTAGTPVALLANSTNKIPFSASGDGFTLPFNPDGWFETSANGLGVVLNLSGAVAVVGCMTYLVL